jgi:NADH:ubiquinone oxidoreductase subunit K
MYNIITHYSLDFFLTYLLILFFFSIFGIFITRKNVIMTLVCLEILFLAVNLNFIIFSVFLDDLFGQVFALYVIAVAGAEAAVGLALLICFYRLRSVIALDYISTLKG